MNPFTKHRQNALPQLSDLEVRKVPVNGNRIFRRRVPLSVTTKQIAIPADTFDSVIDCVCTGCDDPNCCCNDVDNFLGLGKRAKARKDRRFEVRMQKKEAKIADRSYKKHVKADALAKRYSGKAEAAIIQAQGEAAANQALASQGIVGNPVQAQPDLATTALNTVGAYLGGQQQQQYEPLQDSSIGLTREEDYPDGEYPDEQPKKDNTMMIVIIAAVAILAFMMLRKK